MAEYMPSLYGGSRDLMPLIFLLLVACGGSSDRGSASGLDELGIPEDFDQRMHQCMHDQGVEDPLTAVAHRQETDSTYAEALEICVQQIAPDAADELLTGELSPGAARDLYNEQLSAVLECVATTTNWAPPERIPYDDEGWISLTAMLDEFATDADAFRFQVDMADCGGPPAPDVPETEYRRG